VITRQGVTDTAWPRRTAAIAWRRADSRQQRRHRMRAPRSTVQETVCSSCSTDSSRPTGDRTELPGSAGPDGGNRDRHRVEGAFDDNYLAPPSGGRSGSVDRG